jgi:signal transduction histidine kinase
VREDGSGRFPGGSGERNVLQAPLDGQAPLGGQALRGADVAERVARAAWGGEPLAAPHAEAVPRARILLVDDTPANLLALEAVLEPLGQELVHAHSGEEALWHLLRPEAADFALILMDVQMPGLTGLETARLIRARERTRTIPLIFITALSRETAYVLQGYQTGAVDYLLKPVDPDVLRSKVRVFVELHRQARLLERQAAELAARARAEEEMRRAAELEQRLLGIVGHDIRSPLQAILTTAQAQLRGAPGAPLPPAQARAFERIARGGERIRQVVDLLLDFTRAALGGGLPVVRRGVDLHVLCGQLLDEVAARAPGRTLVAELAPGALRGEWDPDRLTQALANLVDNAVKYGDPTAPVRLVVHAEAEAVRLEVHNRGEPIAPDALPTLFEPFRRAVAAAAQGEAAQGLGLGLYIVHEVARAHGGRVEVHSSREEGTVFRLSLPRWAPDGAGQLAAAGEGGPAAPPPGATGPGAEAGA